MVERWEMQTARRKVEQKGCKTAERMVRSKVFQMVEPKVAMMVLRWAVLMARQMAAQMESLSGGHLDEIQAVAKVVP